MDVANNDDHNFKDNFRMFRKSFDKICEKVKDMKKANTQFRKAIPLEKRVAIALYALGSSAEYRSVGNLFGVGKSTVCEILLEFCREIWRVLKPEYLNFFPISQDKAKECIAGFETLGFPQCIGAIGNNKFIIYFNNRF